MTRDDLRGMPRNSPLPGSRTPSKTGYRWEEALQYHRHFDLAKWPGEGETARFAYLMTPELFPHAWIHRAGPIADLALTPLETVGEIRTRTYLGRLKLDEYVQAAPIDGFLVLHRGRIVFERYPRMRPFDKHIWWSVSKAVVALLVAIQEDRGLVDVRRPIETYLPELAGSDWRGTPILDILDMASGMTGLESDDPEAYTNPGSPYGRYEGSLGMQPRTADTPASTYHYIPSLSRQKPSGQVFEYTSVNTFVLSWLAERLTDTPFPELVSREIWRKIGAESDAMHLVSAIGAPATHGTINSTLRDMARFGLLFTPSWGTVCREKLVSEAYLGKIQKGGRPEVFVKGNAAQALTAAAGEQPRHNTYQWDFVLEDGDFYKGGFMGQMLYVSPSRDLVVTAFATGTEGDAQANIAYARALAKSGLFAA